MAMKRFPSVDAYIASFPPEVAAKLRTLRKTIRDAVPEAQESVSYGMPAYKLHRPLLYFAAFRDHYSLFGASSELRQRFAELSKYDGGKGTIRFPHEMKVPVALVRRIAKFRAKQDLERAKAKLGPKPAVKRKKRAVAKPRKSIDG